VPVKQHNKISEQISNRSKKTKKERKKRAKILLNEKIAQSHSQE